MIECHLAERRCCCSTDVETNVILKKMLIGFLPKMYDDTCSCDLEEAERRPKQVRSTQLKLLDELDD